jgi:alkylhydroperoxidase family enzyme
MPLVNPIDIDDPAIEEMVKFYNETLGFCPNSIRTMQIRPDIAKAFVSMNTSVMANHGRVTSALKRLMAYVSSNATGCQYCQAHTIRAAERAALDFSVAASLVPNGVDQIIQANLKKHWDDGEIVEMMGVIALFGYLNRWNDSMGTTIEDAAIESGDKFLAKKGWTGGKHR